MPGGFLSGDIRVIGKEVVEAKLAAAPAHILEQNRLMVESMLTWVKTETVAKTPYGPGHFGYHLRDRFETDVKFLVTKTIGVLKSPATGYWREYGTLGSARRVGRIRLTAHEARMVIAAGSGQGERAFMVAHKALSGARQIIKMFYSGNANWWRL